MFGPAGCWGADFGSPVTRSRLPDCQQSVRHLSLALTETAMGWTHRFDLVAVARPAGQEKIAQSASGLMPIQLLSLFESAKSSRWRYPAVAQRSLARTKLPVLDLKCQFAWKHWDSR